jgi:hypothetical protein
MAEELGPIEIECDAPSYAVVKACVGLGFITPQDVRWQRIDRHSVAVKPIGFFGWRKSKPPRCHCGEEVPMLHSYTFTFLSGSQVCYFVSQCRRCRTVFWDRE